MQVRRKRAWRWGAGALLLLLGLRARRPGAPPGGTPHQRDEQPPALRDDNLVPTNLTAEERVVGEAYVKSEGVNVLISDRIGYRRRFLTDPRPAQCEFQQYSGRLPAASVVIIFRDEPLSALLRTVWSVLYTLKLQRPDETEPDGHPSNWTYLHLHEILLVDDASQRPELGHPLRHFVSTSLPRFVTVIRIKDNVGIAGARLEGARRARGEVLVFLDGHCEATRDWLRPLLARLQLRPRIAAMPVVDLIRYNDFQYVPYTDEFSMGGFSFDGYFESVAVPEREERRRRSDIGPVRTPTMMGCIFAMKRDYFWAVGGYDEGMRGWGAENIELSFRLWMCGGGMEIVPCSHVGHLARDRDPYRVLAPTHTSGGGMEIVPCSHVGHLARDRDPYRVLAPTHTNLWVNNIKQLFGSIEEQAETLHFLYLADVNTARVAEVWMDEYKEIFYLFRPHLRKSPLLGDVRARQSLRARLQCRSFHWYLTAVYPEKIVPIRDTLAFGRIVHVSSGQCVADMPPARSPMTLTTCPDHLLEFHNYLLTRSGQLVKDDDMCATAQRAGFIGNSMNVFMETCAENNQQQRWRYLASRQLVNEGTGKCLEAPPGSGPEQALTLASCSTVRHQRWDFEFSKFKPFKPPDSEQAKAFAQLVAWQNDTGRDEHAKKAVLESDYGEGNDYDDVQPPTFVR